MLAVSRFLREDFKNRAFCPNCRQKGMVMRERDESVKNWWDEKVEDEKDLRDFGAVRIKPSLLRQQEPNPRSRKPHRDENNR